MFIEGTTVQSITFIIVGLLLIAILLKVLSIVHRQAGRVRELEARMKAFENIEPTDLKEETNG